jgi:hypothetical protein
MKNYMYAIESLGEGKFHYFSFYKLAFHCFVSRTVKQLMIFASNTDEMR